MANQPKILAINRAPDHKSRILLIAVS